MRVESIKDHALSRPSHDASAVDDSVDTPVIRVCRGIEWRFETTSVFRAEKPGREQISRRPGRVLSPSSSGMLTLFHDLLALGNYRFESPFLSTADPTERSWANTSWGSVDFQWPVPACASFWELDLFRAAWNHALQQRTSGSPIEHWAFAWIAAGCAMIDYDPPEQLETTGTTSDRKISGAWGRLVERMEEVASRVEDTTARSIQATEWLVGIAALTMPEYALPNHVVDRFHGSEGLKKFWRKNEPSRAIRRLRGHSLARLMITGRDEVANRLRAKPLEAVGHLLVPRSDYVSALAERLISNQERTELLNLPDVVRRPEERTRRVEFGLDTRLPDPMHVASHAVFLKSRVVRLLRDSSGEKRPVMIKLGYSPDNYAAFNKMLDEFKLDADDFKPKK